GPAVAGEGRDLAELLAGDIYADDVPAEIDRRGGPRYQDVIRLVGHDNVIQAAAVVEDDVLDLADGRAVLHDDVGAHHRAQAVDFGGSCGAGLGRGGPRRLGVREARADEREGTRQADGASNGVHHGETLSVRGREGDC